MKPTVKLILAIRKHTKKGLLYIAILWYHTLDSASTYFVSLSDIMVINKEFSLQFYGKIITKTQTAQL